MYVITTYLLLSPIMAIVYLELGNLGLRMQRREMGTS